MQIVIRKPLKLWSYNRRRHNKNQINQTKNVIRNVYNSNINVKTFILEFGPLNFLFAESPNTTCDIDLLS